MLYIKNRAIIYTILFIVSIIRVLGQNKVELSPVYEKTYGGIIIQTGSDGNEYLEQVVEKEEKGCYKNPSGEVYRTLYKFELSQVSIPQNFYLSNAKLIISLNPESNYIGTLSLGKVLNGWEAYELAPYFPKTSTIYKNATIESNNSSVQTLEFEITSYVLSWINNAKTNHGLLLKMYSEKTHGLMSEVGALIYSNNNYEANKKPRLELTFSPKQSVIENEALNWSYQSTFNEEGVLTSESMQYMDNGGGVMQTQVRSIQDNNYLTQQTVKNEYGIAGLSTLAAPNFNTKFQYKSGFIKNINGQEYTSNDFRKRNITNAAGEINNPVAVGNSEKGSVGWYYSNNNNIRDHSSIPASGYPYVANDISTKFKPGVIQRSSMAGEGLQMGSGHESKEITMPTTGELYYVFGISTVWDKILGGSNSPSDLFNGFLINNRIVKKINKDPNGIERIQFYDIDGKILAECKSGVGNRYLNVKSEISNYYNYVDIHLPSGCEKTLQLDYYGLDKYLIYDIETEKYVMPNGVQTHSIENAYYNTGVNPANLKPGYYRIYYWKQGGQTHKLYISYQLRYDEFTLYYYDKAGRLTTVIPPSGVDYTYKPVVSRKLQAAFLLPEDNQTLTYNYNYGTNDNPYIILDAYIATTTYDPYCSYCGGNNNKQVGQVYTYESVTDSNISSNIGQSNTTNFNNIYNIDPNGGGEYRPPLPTTRYFVNYDFAFKYKITYTDNTEELSAEKHISARLLRYSKTYLGRTWHNSWEFSDNFKINFTPIKAKKIKSVSFHLIHVHPQMGIEGVEQSIGDPDFYNPAAGIDSVTIYKNQLYFNAFSKTINVSGQTLYHKMAKTYKYNSLGQVTESYTPDAGTVKYWYDDLGRLKYSQTQEQINFTEETNKQKRNFVDYDKSYRVIASGTYVQNQTGDEISTSTSIIETNQSKTVDINLVESNQIVYDVPFENLASFAELPETYVQHNTQGEVSYTRNDNSMTFYSYDEYARVEWMVVHNYDIGAKTFHYQYDANGNIEKFIYQKDTPKERFEHEYYYDADGRLTKVMAINYRVYKDGEIHPDDPKELAKYYYYLHGPLRRVEIDRDLQGIDYVYTINNWLKSINTPAKEDHNYITQDIGLDGNANNEHSDFKPDVFGMSIDYFNGDYQRSGKEYLNNTNLSNAPQYNGNIRAVNWKNTIEQNAIADNKQCVYNYSYNNNNWLTEAKYDVYNQTTNVYDPNPDRNFDMTNITYDNNGNILTLYRNAYKTGGMNIGTIDRLQYNYAPNSNKLLFIADAEASNGFDGEIGIEKDQITDNYQYDANGRLIADIKKGHYFIYTETDLVKAIYNDANHEKLIVEYDYNEYGQRICKRVPLGRETQETWYINTPGGGTFAVYNRTITENEVPTHSLSQIMLMGGSRIGVFEKQDNKYKFELTDHLGNTRTVISRNITGDSIVFHTAADYYPWGLEMPGRTSNLSNFRFGHQGQFAEKDPETNYDNFELRMWDSRICRWMVPDPYQQYHSSYVGMGNNPINLIDPDGGLTVYVDGQELKGSIARTYLNNSFSYGNMQTEEYIGEGGNKYYGANKGGSQIYMALAAQRMERKVEKDVDRMNAMQHNTMEAPEDEITWYVDMDYSMVLHTNDGSNNIVQVPNNKLGNFKQFAGFQNNDPSYYDSKMFNNFWTSEFGLANKQLTSAQIAVLGWQHSERAKINAVNYFLNPTISNFASYSFSEVGAQWLTPELVVGGLSAGIAGISAVNNTITHIDDIIKNPSILKNKSLANVQKILKNKSNGWVEGSLTKGRSAGKGWTLRQLNSRGTDFTDLYIQYSPGSTRHFGGVPYWKVSSGAKGTTWWPAKSN